MIEKSKMLNERLPELQVLKLEMDVHVRPLDEQVAYAMNERFKQLAKAISIEEISKFENIKWGRQGFRRLGKDPTKYRLSSEKLIRRVAKNDFPPLVNNVVDVMNWLSIELQAPIGVYDLEQVTGKVSVDCGHAEETYNCLAGYRLNLEGLPLLRDSMGPFGAPVSDSLRTAVTNETEKILICIFNFNPSESMSEIRQITEVFTKKMNQVQCP